MPKRSFSCSSVSEFGADYGLQRGRFNSLATTADDAFLKYWWKEIGRFEKYLLSLFPEDSIFVSDHVPLYKSFTIEPSSLIPLKRLCEAALAYLQKEHSDASIIISHPFDSVMPTGSLILTLESTWIEQDVCVWVLERAGNAFTELLSLGNLRARSESISLRKSLEWCGTITARDLPPQTFWQLVYSGNEFANVGRTGKQEAKDYEIGSHIVSALSDRFWILEADGTSDVYISWSLPKDRLIKVECARHICDATFVQEVIQLVREFDTDWAIRFAIFEDLIAYDSYIGGMIVKNDDEILLENAGK